MEGAQELRKASVRPFFMAEWSIHLQHLSLAEASSGGLCAIGHYSEEHLKAFHCHQRKDDLKLVDWNPCKRNG